LSLYAEEAGPALWPAARELPQAFTRLALINAITHVIRAEGAASPDAFSVKGNRSGAVTKPATDDTGSSPST
jgi:hypothetical protein